MGSFFVIPDVDKNTLQRMKQKCIMLSYEAEAARDAYKEAMQDYWQGWFRKALNNQWLYPATQKQPVYAELLFDTGWEHVQVIGLSVTGSAAFLLYHWKTKSGAWSKGEYSVELPCSIRPAKTLSSK